MPGMAKPFEPTLDAPKTRISPFTGSKDIEDQV